MIVTNTKSFMGINVSKASVIPPTSKLINSNTPINSATIIAIVNGIFSVNKNKLNIM